MTPMQLLVVIVWLGTGLIAAPQIFAGVQAHWGPESAAHCHHEDRIFSLLIGLSCGPLALLVVAMVILWRWPGWRVR